MLASKAAVCVLAIGHSGPVGRPLPISLLLNWERANATAPHYAACSVSADGSFWLIRNPADQHVGSARHVLTWTTTAIVALVGRPGLEERRFTVDLSVDRMLLVKSYVLEVANARSRLSASTAAVFPLFGLALSLIDWQAKCNDWPAQLSSTGAVMRFAFGFLKHAPLPFVRIEWRSM